MTKTNSQPNWVATQLLSGFWPYKMEEVALGYALGAFQFVHINHGGGRWVVFWRAEVDGFKDDWWIWRHL